MVQQEDKIFFVPGDVVTLKQELPNKPTMIVVKKESSYIHPKWRPNDEDYKKKFFQGIKCRWFTKDGLMQEATFSTKDLIKI